MAGWLGRTARAAAGKLLGPAPFSEIGVGGTAMYGGYPAHDPVKPQLQGVLRWRKAHEIVSDFSIVAASLRYFLNLSSRPSWHAKPPSDKQEAKDVAEFVESVINGCDQSWSRMIRRQAMFRFHGFGVHEWVAKKRDDGKIGIAKIAPRPQRTIERWDTDPHGEVLGVWQRAPQDSRSIYLPRAKLLYFVDDMFTDDPQGMGWFRQLVEPADLLREYLKLEKVGFSRDLSGIPVGRAPISAINAKIGTMIADGKGGERMFTAEDAETMIKGLRDFVSLKTKQPDTGLVLDSQPFVGKAQDGTTVSTVLQWGLDILTGKAESIEALGKAISRISYDMALIIGTEDLLIGREGQGSRALSQNKTKNLYSTINSTLSEMAETADRDLVGPICALNGIPDELRPTLESEDASFQDVEAIAATLKDMAAAGATLMPDDPAIDDVRDLLGISPQPELSPEMLGMVRPSPGSVKPNNALGKPGQTNNPTSTENDAGN